MRRVMVAAGLSLMVAVAGCGGDDGKDTTPGNRSTTSSRSSVTSTTTAPCNFAGTTAPQQNALASEAQLLADVIAARNGCVDTITFTFRPSAAAAPSYQATYDPGPFANSAGEQVHPEGSAFLKVRFEPAWIADLSQEAAPPTYTGPKLITPTGLNAVRQIALYDANEAVVAWVIGLDGERPIRVEPSPGKVIVTIGPA